jgi:hypothetical protein
VGESAALAVGDGAPGGDESDARDLLRLRQGGREKQKAREDARAARDRGQNHARNYTVLVRAAPCAAVMAWRLLASRSHWLSCRAASSGVCP